MYEVREFGRISEVELDNLSFFIFIFILFQLTCWTVLAACLAIAYAAPDSKEADSSEEGEFLFFPHHSSSSIVICVQRQPRDKLDMFSAIPSYKNNTRIAGRYVLSNR
jgi:hypothetical protein